MICDKTEKIDLLNFLTNVTLYLLKINATSKPCKKGQKIVHFPREILKIGGDHTIERTARGKQRKCKLCRKNARKQCSSYNAGFH